MSTCDILPEKYSCQDLIPSSKTAQLFALLYLFLLYLDNNIHTLTCYYHYCQTKLNCAYLNLLVLVIKQPFCLFDEASCRYIEHIYMLKQLHIAYSCSLRGLGKLSRSLCFERQMSRRERDCVQTNQSGIVNYA
jgi:hypothetical protein